jgi:peptidoglycan/xylan/chitin deacetylase (PgdA/CDA1 family)
MLDRVDDMQAKIGIVADRRAPASRPMRALLRLLAPGGRRAKLTTLIFHRVHARPDPLFPNEMDVAAFRERLRWIGAWFNVLPLEDAVAALAHGTLPERALSITFDDGYADNVEVALPILRQCGLPATFFIATGFLDGGRMWNDTVIEALRRASSAILDLSPLGLGSYALDSMQARRAAIASLLGKLKYLHPDARDERALAIASIAGHALPDDLMMTSAQVRTLAASGMGIGAHTATHPILTSVDASRARHDIADGRDSLQGIVGGPVCLFAYPNGKPGVDYAGEHVSIVRELGFAAAVSTSRGAARSGASPFELPRFTPWEADAARWGYRLARNLLVRPSEAAA